MKDGRWIHWSFLNAVVSYGLSQPYMSLAQARPEAFPRTAGFAAWTLLWVWILPWLFLNLCDLLLRRRGTESRSFHLWRSSLLAVLFLSLLRQLWVFHQELYAYSFGLLHPAVAAAVATAVAFALLAHRGRISGAVSTYLSYAGLCALALPVVFAWSLLHFQPAPAGEAPQRASCTRTLPSVYLVVFDELSLDVLLRGDLIDPSRYPNFAALAADSIWFRNATTNHWATVDSLPTLLTGKISPRSDDRSLFELLPDDRRTMSILTEVEVENRLRHIQREQGIQEYAGKARILTVKPLAAGAFIYQRLLGYLTFRQPENVLFDDPEYHATLREEEAEFLQSIDPGHKQFLMWHCSLPHSPFLFTADGSRHHRKNDYFPGAGVYHPSMFRGILQNYEEQLRYTDSILGKIVTQLKSAGVYDRSILIVTSDHGLRIWGEIFDHVDLTARVPVFLRIPGRKPYVSDADFQLADLAPTLLDLAGCAPSIRKPDGIAAFAGPHPARQPVVHFYPANVSCTLDPATGAWIRISGGEQGAMAVTQSSGGSERGFSAVQVLDDVMQAREKKGDFLEFYLARHFPTTITDADVTRLEQNLASLQGARETPQLHYKKGTYLFFLALARTMLVSNGRPQDVVTVNRNWNQAVEELRKAGDIQPWVAEDIERLLTDSDASGDGTLDAGELTAMIRTRTQKR